MSEMAEAFERTCRDRRADTALLWLPEARAIGFGELWQQYERLRAELQRQRVGNGDCVVSLVGTHPVFFSLVVACMQVGATLLPLGEATDAEALAIVDRSDAVAVVTDRSLPLDSADSSEVDRGLSIFRLRSRPAHSYGQSVVIKLTSGSTDLPKATLAAERALISDGQSIAAGMTIGPRDMNMAVIPLSHSFAIGNIVVPLVIQGTAAALRPSFNPAQFLADARVSGATVFPGVPFMFDWLRGPIAETAVPASLRLLITAGARIDPGTVRWFHEHGRKIHSFYGASETGGITSTRQRTCPIRARRLAASGCVNRSPPRARCATRRTRKVEARVRRRAMPCLDRP
jgi:acyl-CoA synthetase (AMP-forming)/AMP-acid ligase II